MGPINPFISHFSIITGLDIGAKVVDIGNISNHPYLENNPYQELDNNDDDDNDNNDDDYIELVVAPEEISETTIDVDEESTGVADKKTKGVLDEHTGVETPDGR